MGRDQKGKHGRVYYVILGTWRNQKITHFLSLFSRQSQWTPHLQRGMPCENIYYLLVYTTSRRMVSRISRQGPSEEIRGSITNQCVRQHEPQRETLKDPARGVQSELKHDRNVQTQMKDALYPALFNKTVLWLTKGSQRFPIKSFSNAVSFVIMNVMCSGQPACKP